ncbi:RNA polymerase sigma factor [Kribbella sp. ALI-6-A]|uniref:RNA polymerase sigma factor n=1 Tax=Kribbella sp. ALI-6-A TaxID=1933817 RepID=UPI00192D1B62|nr:sigma-70 family RNA polymerase sigma factor [Kribbella sp. ALI-6-A]
MDADLTRSAQAGDVTALGTLLVRHQAGMRAVALSLLGHSPDVDDVLQDAALTALRRIGDVRDPSAVGAWLRMVVRNACRTRLRSMTYPLSVDELALVAPDLTPEQQLDHHALRDWIWHAMEQLPPQTRLAIMLRHFSTSVTSYQQIAAACGVPIGTVRSRLSLGRARLSEALLATADSAHGDARALVAASEQEARETLAAAERGEFSAVLDERWSPEVALLGGPEPIVGHDFLDRGMDSDLSAGVHQRVAHVVASRDIAIWEMDMLNPADDPEHCPPAVTWLMSLRDGRVQQLRLFHPASVSGLTAESVN